MAWCNAASRSKDNGRPIRRRGGIEQLADNIAALDAVLAPEHRAELDAASAPEHPRMLDGLFTPMMRQHVIFGGSAVEGWSA